MSCSKAHPLIPLTMKAVDQEILEQGSRISADTGKTLPSPFILSLGNSTTNHAIKVDFNCAPLKRQITVSYLQSSTTNVQIY